jgi:hypothetical protein
VQRGCEPRSPHGLAPCPHADAGRLGRGAGDRR